MNDNIWFGRDLPPASQVDASIETVKDLTPDELAELTGDSALANLTKGEQAAYARQVGQELRGIVRAHWPSAKQAPLDGPLGDAASYARGTPYLVKLGVESDLPEELKAAKCRYKKVWCRAFISAPADCRPLVLDVLPDKLYAGEPRMVKVEVKPSLKLEAVEFSLGGLSTDVQVGIVAR